MSYQTKKLSPARKAPTKRKDPAKPRPDPYDWQLEAVSKLKQSKSLLIEAPPGVGKSLVGALAQDEIGDAIVITHSNALAEQWQEDYGMEAITVQSALKMNISKKILILDEVHHYESPVWSQIHQHIKSEYVLGLSATPGEARKRFADTMKIGWSSAKLPEHRFIYSKFKLDPETRASYSILTRRISNTIKNEELSPDEKQELIRNLSLERRRLVHNSPARTEALIAKIPWILGMKTLLVFETIEQCEKVCNALKIPTYHSRNANAAILEDFASKEYAALGSVKMLKEGFDVPDIDTVIIASSALTETHIVQVIGRGLRYMEDKNVNFYLFVAEETSDEKLIGLAESVMTGKPTAESLQFKYKRGKEYSMDYTRRIFITDDNHVRHYFQKTGLEDKIWQAKIGGGKFRIFDNEVLVQTKDGVVSVGTIEKLIAEETDTYGWDALMADLKKKEV